MDRQATGWFPDPWGDGKYRWQEAGMWTGWVHLGPEEPGTVARHRRVLRRRRQQIVA